MLSVVVREVKAQDVLGASSEGINTTHWGVKEGLSKEMKLFKGMILLNLGIGLKKTGIHHPADGKVN